ncbi:MAG: hypothetical protein QOH63_3996 [Acidobacteriota bacterium]|nr:hypothetical protein [Acidobacteriota bacterium]
MFGGGNKAKAAVGGPVCNVPTDYPTIQAAVNDSGCATINVAPGVYNENVNIPRSLTLKGAQAGVDARGRLAAESNVNGANPINGNAVFAINAAGVTIDGFTLKNSLTTGAAYGISVNSAGNNAVITNNIFDGISTTDTGGNGTAQAIYLQGGPDSVNISNNEMKNIQSTRSAKGVLIGDNGGTNSSSNTVIEANSMSFIMSFSKGAYGISVGNVTPGTPGLQILSNTIDNLNGGGWVHAIGLEGNTPGAIVSGNEISNLNSSSPDSLAVWFESNPSFATAQVHSNNFNLTTASFGIAVQPTLPAGSVDGSCNWWNSPTGPTAASNPGGTGAQVSAKVIYAPWLIAPAPGGACIGGNVATTASQCKNGGWTMRVRADGSTFKNQGDCIQYVNTGK